MGKSGDRTVVLKFFGTIAKWAGLEQENLRVSGDFRACVSAVRERIQQRTEGKILYLVLYNGANITRVDQETTAVQDGDEFQAVPIVLGG
jgi:molybdopterin converting factor small subunit